MTVKTHARGLGRRSLLRVLLALPVAFSFPGLRPAPAGEEEKPDDIVEINGWILRRSDLS